MATSSIGPSAVPSLSVTTVCCLRAASVNDTMARPWETWTRMPTICCSGWLRPVRGLADACKPCLRAAEQCVVWLKHLMLKIARMRHVCRFQDLSQHIQPRHPDRPELPPKVQSKASSHATGRPHRRARRAGASKEGGGEHASALRPLLQEVVTWFASNRIWRRGVRIPYTPCHVEANR